MGNEFAAITFQTREMGTIVKCYCDTERIEHDSQSMKSKITTAHVGGSSNNKAWSCNPSILGYLALRDSCQSSSLANVMRCFQGTQRQEPLETVWCTNASSRLDGSESELKISEG